MFKIVKTEAGKNLTKLTSRKILALWLIFTLLLTILAPKIFDLKDYKTDHILLMMLFFSTLFMIFIIFIIKFFTRTKEDNQDKN
jgi:hypothetical protein